MAFRVEEDAEEAVSRRVRGTPAFFLNDRFVEGVPSFADIERLI
jgi:protein-disulfide isomerase